jgi:Fur family peroxide stress response transcriptional regulator
MISREIIRNKLIRAGLKVTPQRLIVLEALHALRNHPTTDQIIEYIGRFHSNIAVGTVYHILEAFLDKNLVKKVKSEGEIIRYDPVLEKHHHLYCTDTGEISDYFDDQLDRLLSDYFREKKIPGFKVEDVRVEITGALKKKRTKPAKGSRGQVGPIGKSSNQ